LPLFLFFRAKRIYFDFNLAYCFERVENESRSIITMQPLFLSEKNAENLLHILRQAHVQKFIRENISTDTASLALQRDRYPDIPVQWAAEQILALQKAQKKLPKWFDNHDIIYPSLLSMEQCSSEQTASYKAEIFKGKRLIDLSGGMGVDSYHFSKSFAQVDYVEPNPLLNDITQHNFQALKVGNVRFFHQTAQEFIQEQFRPEGSKADMVYVDPSRRDENKKRTFRLEDCEPNILTMIKPMLRLGHQVLIKTSPMLDIHLAIKQLQCVKQIIVIAVGNDCKEVLYLLAPNAETKDLTMLTAHFQHNKPPREFEFEWSVENELEITYTSPMKYIYEPNPAILKAGAFKSVALIYGFHKLHPHSHLYTSPYDFSFKFAGRTFELLHICNYDKKELAKILPEKQANITVRNFPATVDEIRKDIGIRDGGDFYIFATTIMKQKKVLLITKKVPTHNQ
jgi:16S rRNA G966 N2-methylase RsmD